MNESVSPVPEKDLDHFENKKDEISQLLIEEAELFDSKPERKEEDILQIIGDLKSMATVSGDVHYPFGKNRVRQRAPTSYTQRPLAEHYKIEQQPPSSRVRMLRFYRPETPRPTFPVPPVYGTPLTVSQTTHIPAHYKAEDVVYNGSAVNMERKLFIN